jgi:hypothetical protein
MQVFFCLCIAACFEYGIGAFQSMVNLFCKCLRIKDRFPISIFPGFVVKRYGPGIMFEDFIRHGKGAAAAMSDEVFIE